MQYRMESDRYSDERRRCFLRKCFLGASARSWWELKGALQIVHERDSPWVASLVLSICGIEGSHGMERYDHNGCGDDDCSGMHTTTRLELNPAAADLHTTYAH